MTGRAHPSAEAAARDSLARVGAYRRVQPQVWIAELAPDAVLAMARAVDARVAAGVTQPLAGLTFAVKDNIDLAGVDTTAACPAFAYRPAASATVVARLMEVGAVPIGKTNLDQFATGLVGVRSPHGAPQCVYNRAYVSGGSSSGSAVAVAAGLVDFALGTDTAGSGRVPAAFNGLFGLKPTRGRWSTRGVVPACRSLDCVSLFTRTLDDAARIDAVLTAFDVADDFSRAPQIRALGRRLGAPRASQLDFGADLEGPRLYRRALAAAQAAGATIVEIDIAPLLEVAALLYDGPWVAERAAAVEDLLARDPDALDPVVRGIVEGAARFSAVDAFRGLYRLQHHLHLAERMWDAVDALLLPTTPCIYRLAELRAAPIALNAHLGRYTNFVNLLDMSALALPAGYRANGTAFGVSLIAPAWSDAALLTLGAELTTALAPEPPPPLDLAGDKMQTVVLAVVGAHLEGMPLHWQLTSRDARFVGSAHTAATYRLYAMAGGAPRKPALVHDASGGAIAVELYELDVAAFGSFVAEVPPPLAIGTVTLDDGRDVKGFVAEPRAIEGGEDITALGGWRAFVARQAG